MQQEPCWHLWIPVLVTRLTDQNPKQQNKGALRPRRASVLDHPPSCSSIRFRPRQQFLPSPLHRFLSLFLIPSFFPNISLQQKQKWWNNNAIDTAFSSPLLPPSLVRASTLSTRPGLEPMPNNLC